MIKIQDIILHRNKTFTQTVLLLDKSPNYLFEREGNFLIGEDSGFFSFYAYDRPSPGFRAFGGRKFKIPMKDGTFIEASGQWWDKTPEDYLPLLTRVGVATLDELEECYCFCGAYVDTKLIEDWLKENRPSNNYLRYDKHSTKYGKQTIEEKYDHNH